MSALSFRLAARELRSGVRGFGIESGRLDIELHPHQIAVIQALEQGAPAQRQILFDWRAVPLPGNPRIVE